MSKATNETRRKILKDLDIAEAAFIVHLVDPLHSAPLRLTPRQAEALQWKITSGLALAGFEYSLTPEQSMYRMRVSREISNSMVMKLNATGDDPIEVALGIADLGLAWFKQKRVQLEATPHMASEVDHGGK